MQTSMVFSSSRVALIGAGAIGRAHLLGAQGAQGVAIVAVADPSEAAKGLASEFRVPWFPDHHALEAAVEIDGAIVATPNALHVSIALDFLERGKAVLVEKPIAGTVEQGRELALAAHRLDVPVLVGHHRRHNPLVLRARELVAQGRLGRLVSATVLATFLKPDSYFDQTWRRTQEAGPVLINLIHEIDLLRFICGEVLSVQAVTSNAVRGFDVEDTAAVVLQLRNGAVATLTLSDAAATPWAWDLVSGENPAFARATDGPADSHFLCGTEGSLTLPSLRLWRYAGKRGWAEPLTSTIETSVSADPYIEQIRHFGAVIRRDELPLTDALDGTRTLEVTMAVREAALGGKKVIFEFD